MGRFTRIGWITFLILSIGWEALELVLPFDFAVETWINKVGDIIINTAGFTLGMRYNKARKPSKEMPQ